MALTFELASFRVAPENEASLVEERPAMIAALREASPGAIAAWLTKQDDDSWLDISESEACGTSRSSTNALRRQS